MSYKPISLQDLSEVVRKNVDPASPKPMRLLAARSITPLKPVERLISLYVLLADPDKEIAQSAAKTFGSLPEAIFTTAISSPDMHPTVLEFIYANLPVSDKRRSIIIQNPVATDDILILGAKTGAPQELEIIADNQKRALGNIEILRALYNNPSTPRPPLLRLIEYAQRDNIIVLGIPELEPSIESQQVVEPAPEEQPVEAAQEVPEWSYEETFGNAQKTLPDLPEEVLKQLPQEELMQIALGAGMDEADESFFEEGALNSEEERLTLTQRMQKMTVAQKIALAQKGNKEVRTLLLRSSNKLILLAVVASPRITDGEVQMLAGSKTVPEDVIRTISKNREWVKDYTIRLSLVYNPKTPFAVATRFMQSLEKKDLQDIAKSKAVSSNVANFARKLFQMRNKSE